MYVLPITDVLNLSRLPFHEDTVDKLVKWEKGMAPVVFASQTWLSFAHPDNADNSKLTLLKDVSLPKHLLITLLIQVRNSSSSISFRRNIFG